MWPRAGAKEQFVNLLNAARILSSLPLLGALCALPALASNAKAASLPPAYIYECDADGFCEGLPTEADVAAAPAVEAPATSTMILASDVRADAIASRSAGFARVAQLPTALVEAQLAQSRIRDLEIFLEGYRTSGAGVTSIDTHVTASGAHK